MKQVAVLFISWFLSAFSYKAMAQNNDAEAKGKRIEKDRKKTEEIIIRRTDDKDVNVTIQIKGDEITVNGKPLSDYKGDDVVVNKRDIYIRDGKSFQTLRPSIESFGGPGSAWRSGSKVMLGVTTEKTEGGVKVIDITEGSAADKAGIEKDDIITKLADTKIEDPQDLYDAVNKKKAGEEVKLQVKRAGKEKTLKATLAERKEMSFSMSTPDGFYRDFVMPSIPEAPHVYDFNAHGFLSSRNKLGLKIQDTEEGNGVKVVDVADESNAEKAGLKENDVITEIGGMKITNTDEARDALNENKDKNSYVVKAKRNGSDMSFTVTIPKKLKTTNL